MELHFDPAAYAELVRAEASCRGHEARLDQLVVRRLEDDLPPDDALATAAEELGLDAALREALERALAPLSEPVDDESAVERVRIDLARGEMPRLEREVDTAAVWLEPAPVEAATRTAQELVTLLRSQPGRRAVVLPVGLGGSGGCAAGECLPEDAPPGPLFEGR